MASEATLRHAVLKLLSPLHAVAIESPMEAGIPDVNCTVGWIELKHLHEWPVRADTVVRPQHFRPAQRHFLKTRCERGGSAWLLLRVADAWLLWWGTTAASVLGESWTRSDGTVPGLVQWPAPPTSPQLISALLSHPWRRETLCDGGRVR